MKTAFQRFVGFPVRVKKLGWFGFSADPPTLAHRAVVDAVLGSGLVEQIVVFPAGSLSYKDFQASDWQRVEMTEIWKAAAGFEDDEVAISRFDVQREKAMTWIELWKELKKLAPQKEHYLIVGSDQYLDIPKSWNDGEQLLQEAQFIVVPRQESPLERVLPHHVLLDIPPIAGSSTEVRRRNLDLVDEMVRKYVLEEGLYEQ